MIDQEWYKKKQDAWEAANQCMVANALTGLTSGIDEEAFTLSLVYLIARAVGKHATCAKNYGCIGRVFEAIREGFEAGGVDLKISFARKENQ